jgi:hypothetical protein
MVPKPLLMMARDQITRLLPSARDNGLTSARNDNAGSLAGHGQLVAELTPGVVGVEDNIVIQRPTPYAYI